VQKTSPVAFAQKTQFFLLFRAWSPAPFPIDFGESGATLQGAFRVLDRILSLGMVSNSTGIKPQLNFRGDRLLPAYDGTLVWSHTSTSSLIKFRHADLNEAALAGGRLRVPGPGGIGGSRPAVLKNSPSRVT